MRIGIDMLADQSAGRLRGTGRYTRGLVAELLADARHEVVLYYYEGLPISDSILYGIPLAAGSEAFFGPNGGWPSQAVTVTGGGPGGPSSGYADRLTDDRERYNKARFRWVPRGDSLHTAVQRLAHENPDGVDLLLLTCPLENFEGYLPPFPTKHGPRLAAIVYDLIPLRFPSQYLTHAGIAASYRRALATVQQYDLLLTISESARCDIAELLPSCSAPVVNIGAASDRGFFGPPAVRPDGEAARWLATQGIHKPFIYAITASDFRKNPTGLLAAWQCLPERVRDRFQCVITCSGGLDGRIYTETSDGPLDKNHGVVFTDALDDDGLRLLYQQATAFVFPSRYEGFGLPLLEALQCGAAVIAGRNSSQVEVVGEAGLLVDVDDPLGFAEQIARLLDDPHLQETLRRRAVPQAQRFCWSAVGRRCLAALDEAHAAPRQSSWLSNWLRVWSARGKLAMRERLRGGTLLRRAG